MPQPLSPAEMRRLRAFLNPTTSTVHKPFQCLECGRKLSTKQAEQAMYGDQGCPGCGGSDIDIAPLPPLRRPNPLPRELLPVDGILPMLNWTILGTPLKTFVVLLGANIALNSLVDWWQEQKGQQA